MGPGARRDGTGLDFRSVCNAAGICLVDNSFSLRHTTRRRMIYMCVYVCAYIRVYSYIRFERISCTQLSYLRMIDTCQKAPRTPWSTWTYVRVWNRNEMDPVAKGCSGNPGTAVPQQLLVNLDAGIRPPRCGRAVGCGMDQEIWPYMMTRAKRQKSYFWY